MGTKSDKIKMKKFEFAGDDHLKTGGVTEGMKNKDTDEHVFPRNP